MKKTLTKKTLIVTLAIVLSLCLVAVFVFSQRLMTPAKPEADYSKFTELSPEAVEKALEWAETLDPSGKDYSTEKHLVIQRATEYLADTIDYLAGDFMTIWWQDHFNIEWDLISLPGSGADERARTLINSGDMPDILDWTNYDLNEIASYIDQGQFKELPSDWKERWPNLARTQEYVPIAEAFAERVGGYYTLFRTTYYNNYPGDVITDHNTIYIRKDWAEAVGFELKDTYSTDEIIEFARLVKEQDPGKLGNRLIPIITSTDYLRHSFLGANYEVYDNIYKGDDGRYRWGFADNETLELLKTIKDAYSEGLIAPEFYTYEQDDAKNTFAMTGTCGALFAAGSSGTISNIAEPLEGFDINDPPEEFEKLHIAALIGNDGYYHGDEIMNYWGATYFSADIDDEVMERYLDMMEFHCSVEWQNRYGFRYIDWDYDENGEPYIIEYDPETKVQVSTSWPLYDLIAVAGDDSTLNPDTISKGNKYYVPYTLAVYENKIKCIGEGTINPIDIDALSLSSPKQAAMTNVNLNNIIANLIVSDGDIEAEWRAAIDENAYIVDPAVDELNELFGE